MRYLPSEDELRQEIKRTADLAKPSNFKEARGHLTARFGSIQHHPWPEQISEFHRGGQRVACNTPKNLNFDFSAH